MNLFLKAHSRVNALDVCNHVCKFYAIVQKTSVLAETERRHCVHILNLFIFFKTSAFVVK